MRRLHETVRNTRPESRTRVLEVAVGLDEDLRTLFSSTEKSLESFCSDFQICLPYAGFFVWHVGHDDVVGDPNQIVFVRGGEAFRMSSPCKSGYAELVVTPEIDVLSEIAHDNGGPLFKHPL